MRIQLGFKPPIILFLLLFTFNCSDLDACSKCDVSINQWNLENKNCDDVEGKLKADLDEKIKLIESKLEIQKENLEYRNTITENWLSVLGLVLTLITIGIPAALFILNRKISNDAKKLSDDVYSQSAKADRIISRFIKDSKERMRFLEHQASEAIKNIQKHEQTSKEYHDEIQNLLESAVTKKSLSVEENQKLISKSQEIKDDVNAPQIEKDIANAFNFYYSGNYSEAIDSFTKILKDYSSEITLERITSIWFSLGYSYGEQENDIKAIEFYKLFLTIHPNDTDTLNNIGNAYFRLKKLKKALFYHTKLISLNSTKAIYWSNLGNTQNMLEDFESSIFSFEKVLELDDEKQEFVNNILPNYIEALIIKNQIEKAKKHLNKLRERNINRFAFRLFEFILLILEGEEIENKKLEFKKLKHSDVFENEESEKWDFRELENWLTGNDSEHINKETKFKIEQLLNFMKSWQEREY